MKIKELDWREPVKEVMVPGLDNNISLQDAGVVSRERRNWLTVVNYRYPWLFVLREYLGKN